jgi:hypothetical protein
MEEKRIRRVGIVLPAKNASPPGSPGSNKRPSVSSPTQLSTEREWLRSDYIVPEVAKMNLKYPPGLHPRTVEDLDADTVHSRMLGMPGELKMDQKTTEKYFGEGSRAQFFNRYKWLSHQRDITSLRSGEAIENLYFDNEKTTPSKCVPFGPVRGKSAKNRFDTENDDTSHFGSHLSQSSSNFRSRFKTTGGSVGSSDAMNEAVRLRESALRSGVRGQDFDDDVAFGDDILLDASLTAENLLEVPSVQGRAPRGSGDHVEEEWDNLSEVTMKSTELRRLQKLGFYQQAGSGGGGGGGGSHKHGKGGGGHPTHHGSQRLPSPHSPPQKHAQAQRKQEDDGDDDDDSVADIQGIAAPGDLAPTAASALASASPGAAHRGGGRGVEEAKAAAQSLSARFAASVEKSRLGAGGASSKGNKDAASGKFATAVDLSVEVAAPGEVLRDAAGKVVFGVDHMPSSLRLAFPTPAYTPTPAAAAMKSGTSPTKNVVYPGTKVMITVPVAQASSSPARDRERERDREKERAGTEQLQQQQQQQQRRPSTSSAKGGKDAAAATGSSSKPPLSGGGGSGKGKGKGSSVARPSTACTPATPAAAAAAAATSGGGTGGDRKAARQGKRAQRSSAGGGGGAKRSDVPGDTYTKLILEDLLAKKNVQAVVADEADATASLDASSVRGRHQRLDDDSVMSGSTVSTIGLGLHLENLRREALGHTGLTSSSAGTGTGAGAGAESALMVPITSPRTKYLAGCMQHGLNPRASLMLRKAMSKQLNLQHHGMGDEMGKILADCIQGLPHIQSINIADNMLTDIGMGPIILAAVGIPSLLELNLSQNEIGPVSAKALFEYLSKFFPLFFANFDSTASLILFCMVLFL